MIDPRYMSVKPAPMYGLGATSDATAMAVSGGALLAAGVFTVALYGLAGYGAYKLVKERKKKR